MYSCKLDGLEIRNDEKEKLKETPNNLLLLPFHLFCGGLVSVMPKIPR